MDDWEWSSGDERKRHQVWQRRAQWLALMVRGMVGILVEETERNWGAERWTVLAKFPHDWPNGKTSVDQECEDILAMMEEMVEEENRAIWMAGLLFWVVCYLVGMGWRG